MESDNVEDAYLCLRSAVEYIADGHPEFAADSVERAFEFLHRELENRKRVKGDRGV